MSFKIGNISVDQAVKQTIYDLIAEAKGSTGPTGPVGYTGPVGVTGPTGSTLSYNTRLIYVNNQSIPTSIDTPITFATDFQNNSPITLNGNNWTFNNLGTYNIFYQISLHNNSVGAQRNIQLTGDTIPLIFIDSNQFISNTNVTYQLSTIINVTSTSQVYQATVYQDSGSVINAFNAVLCIVKI